MISRQLKVAYYAALREARGMSEEALQTSAATPAELYAELCERYAFRLRPEQVRVAVNDAFCSWDYRLEEGDRVVFIPPVAGG